MRWAVLLSLALWLLIGLVVYAVRAQAPNSNPGCVYNATLATLSDKQTVAVQCNSSGQLLLH